MGMNPVSQIAWRAMMNQPKNTLDQWEAEAKYGNYSIASGSLIEDELDKRILALIDLVRKKDEALEQEAHDSHDPTLSKSLNAIIALTEKLK